ncbi:pyrolysin [Thermococcus sp. SY098]|uniref:pyrolysin n=1 Tax=Thermococcus sp. SY098 TaxID=3111325 RepID=UPI002D7994B8|nr:pyrolysin [Thermococcus sp. SY098]WRS51853.1 pyrolysin [Thermococcus sp. SY098]
MKKIASLVIVFLFLASSIGFGSFPEVSAQSNYSNQRVLLLKNVDAWGSNAVEEMLDEIGVPYDVLSSSEFAPLTASDLINKYDVIIIESDQPQNFYDELAPEMGDIEEFVKAGKVLQVHAANWGWHGGVWKTPLPGGVEIVKSYSNYDYNVEKDLWYYSTFASHGYLTNLPQDAKIITVQSDTRYSQGNPDYTKPSAVTYTFGKGLVFATGLTLEYSAEYRGAMWKEFLKEIIIGSLEFKPAKKVEYFDYAMMNYIWYMLYNRYTEKFDEMYKETEQYNITNSTIPQVAEYKSLAEKHYELGWQYGHPIKGHIQALPHMRRAYMNIKKAYVLLDYSLKGLKHWQALENNNLTALIQQNNDASTLYWVGGPLNGTYKGIENAKATWSRFLGGNNVTKVDVYNITLAKSEEGMTGIRAVVIVSTKEGKRIPLRYEIYFKDDSIIEEWWIIDPSVLEMAKD